MRQAAADNSVSLDRDPTSMANMASEDDAADPHGTPPLPQFDMRGVLLAVHLVCTLLSVPGVGLFVWQAAGPLAAITAAVIVGQCTVMLLVAILGWLPGKDERM